MAYPDGRNDLAARAAYEYGTSEGPRNLTWDDLPYPERNHWRNLAFAARLAAGDIVAPDMGSTRHARPVPGVQDRSRQAVGAQSRRMAG